MFSEIKKSVASGLLITIGGCVYLTCNEYGLGWFGSILFSAGLFTICEYQFNLYTGKVGYIACNFKDTRYILLVLRILLVNLLTSFLMGILVGRYFPVVSGAAKKIYEAKLNCSLVKSFISAVFCGILMYLAVDTWKRGKKIGVFIYIPVFIMCGFDHSIANSFYNGAALGEHTFTLANAALTTVVILGNAAGGMIFLLLIKER